MPCCSDIVTIGRVKWIEGSKHTGKDNHARAGLVILRQTFVRRPRVVPSDRSSGSCGEGHRAGGPRHADASTYLPTVKSGLRCAMVAQMTDLSLPVPDRSAAAQSAGVTATELGAHLALSRQHVGRLADDHVIERLPNGRFDQDACRLAYLKWLRDPARRSARTEADAAHVRAKTDLLRLRVMEKRREFVRRDDVNELLDSIAGVVLTKLGGLPARIAGTDLMARRKAEAVIIEIRREIALACSAMGDERGEPDEP
jgi:hypothetical protein